MKIKSSASSVLRGILFVFFLSGCSSVDQALDADTNRRLVFGPGFFMLELSATASDVAVALDGAPLV